jgi:hypothetical protein
MGFTDFIIKLSNTKFARKFQYEPYIIKSVEYINPDKDDSVCVIFKEADYLKSLMSQYVKTENYAAFEVSKEMDSDKIFDKVVLFFSINDLKKHHTEFIKSHLRNKGHLYSIFYLNSGKFFEWTLKLTDKDVLKSMDKENNILKLAGFVLEDELKLPKLYISVSKYFRR